MTTPLRMDKDHSDMTERIFTLTLEIICLLTGERFPPVRSDNHVTITVSPSHPLIFDRYHKQSVLEVTRKMMELLTGEVPGRCQDVTLYFSMEEWQYLEGHTDLYKDVMMENQLPLTSMEGSNSRNPPARSTDSLYSQHCPQEGLTIHHHYQEENVADVKAEGEEEETTDRRGGQQSTEQADMMGTINKEDETYVRSDQQSMEKGKMMRTIKEEEEEMYEVTMFL
ncbi:gastrula zinc finger protein XlCGF66.1-like [Hyperolius riggenbachi]|uniref:gastrula zinc finger protein XlCGF66.1-like n=1 Tax=Hyperolius riggenbachi TaxID=752182 RepID=UPI0035A26A8E